MAGASGTTFLVDASIFIFRAWFSIPDAMTDPDNNPVNAFYGYARFLGDFLEQERPAHIAVAFDESLTTSFRNALYPEYKANREPAPPELKRQFAACRELTRAMGIMECADAAFEADDLIGTIAGRMRDAGHAITVVTRDKDLVQLLTEGDTWWDYSGRRRVAYHEVHDEFGVHAEQMADLLALAGDSVDNIPGVPGVGIKTATALLQHFEGIDDLYNNLGRVADVPVRGAGKLAGKLEAHADNVRLWHELALIRCDVPVDAGESAVRRAAPDTPALEALYDRAGFGAALRRQAGRIAAQFD